MSVPVALTIASSDSGGGAGIQADLKAFAHSDCHGASVIVALTAQNTQGVRAIHECPPEFVREQLEAVFDDLPVGGAKTGMLFSAAIIQTVGDYLADHRVPLVVDPVLIASSGAKLLRDDAVDALVQVLFPLATVITPNLPEAQALTGMDVENRRALAERLHDLGAAAVVITGGHGERPVEHFFDGERHLEIPVSRHEIAATHGAGCTHSATLAALLARGEELAAAVGIAPMVAAWAVEHGLEELGAGDGPVDVFNLKGSK